MEKALGWRKRDICYQLLSRALIISVANGVLGARIVEGRLTILARLAQISVGDYRLFDCQIACSYMQMFMTIGGVRFRITSDLPITPEGDYCVSQVD